MAPQLGSIDGRGRGDGARPRRRYAGGGEGGQGELLRSRARSPRGLHMIWSFATMAPQLGSIDGRGRGYAAHPRPHSAAGDFCRT